jgi:hypothetical protein
MIVSVTGWDVDISQRFSLGASWQWEKLVSKEAVAVEMAGGEYHRIKGMGMIMNESAGEGLPDVKNVAVLCCCMTNQGDSEGAQQVKRYPPISSSIFFVIHPHFYHPPLSY